MCYHEILISINLLDISFFQSPLEIQLLIQFIGKHLRKPDLMYQIHFASVSLREMISMITSKICLNKIIWEKGNNN